MLGQLIANEIDPLTVEELDRRHRFADVNCQMLSAQMDLELERTEHMMHNIGAVERIYDACTASPKEVRDMALLAIDQIMGETEGHKWTVRVEEDLVSFETFTQLADDDNVVVAAGKAVWRLAAAAVKAVLKVIRFFLEKMTKFLDWLIGMGDSTVEKKEKQFEELGRLIAEAEGRKLNMSVGLDYKQLSTPDGWAGSVDNMKPVLELMGTNYLYDEDLNAVDDSTKYYKDAYASAKADDIGKAKAETDRRYKEYADRVKGAPGFDKVFSIVTGDKGGSPVITFNKNAKLSATGTENVNLGDLYRKVNDLFMKNAQKGMTTGLKNRESKFKSTFRERENLVKNWESESSESNNKSSSDTENAKIATIRDLAKAMRDDKSEDMAKKNTDAIKDLQSHSTKWCDGMISFMMTEVKKILAGNDEKKDGDKKEEDKPESTKEEDKDKK